MIHSLITILIFRQFLVYTITCNLIMELIINMQIQCQCYRYNIQRCRFTQRVKYIDSVNEYMNSNITT